MMESSPGPRFFGTHCKFCGTVAESWHEKFREQAPDSATIGMAYCECGRTGADSSDRPGMGRISIHESEDRET
jgi:hypothetical protein